MSGSPLYVTTPAATCSSAPLSYGDIFTLNGMAPGHADRVHGGDRGGLPGRRARSLGPPRPPARAVRLDGPVHVPGDGGAQRGSRDPQRKAAAEVDAASGQTVMAPLGILEIGGARPGSKTFERIAARFAKTGLLVKAASGSGEWAGAPTPALEAGSPCAVLFSQGAVWVGAAGTVTYVDDDVAMLFGHPFEQLGAIDAVLTGGDVQGVWASTNTPYKLIAPRDVKGTCVQDRSWGVEAHLGQTPDIFPVATTATVVERQVSTHDESGVSEWLVTSDAYPTLPGDIVGEVVLRGLGPVRLPRERRRRRPPWSSPTIRAPTRSSATTSGPAPGTSPIRPVRTSARPSCDSWPTLTGCSRRGSSPSTW